MKKDKIKTYIFESVICIMLFFALFVPNIFTKIVLAVIIALYALITCKTLKKRNIISMYNKQLTILMLLLGIVYLMLFYLMGLYFGYYESTVKLSMWSLINYTIPIAIIIIASEIMRSIFLAEKSNLSKILTLIPMVLIDVIIYNNIYQLTTFDGFLHIISFTVFASTASNLLYNYISIRFGCKPIIAFRLITVLYAYIIPIIPDVYIFFRCFLRIVYPYLIYLLLEKNYSKDNFAVAIKDKKKTIIVNVTVITMLILFVMLISCKFKYGMLVIATGSMTGTINKGDAVIYRAYDKQTISIGDIIIYEENGMYIVHRVVDMEIINGEHRYYTQGDANQQIDDGYRVNSDIVGLTKFRLMYAGYPTIWIRDIFTKL